ncbi:MAG: hypothetical protein JWL77_562 [Chthonomonadaceae bacterium]|nr:hypothetical protein [Chthonomonadaceae bacterium]
MSPRDYACKRLSTFLEEVARLKTSEFPYSHSKEALERLNQLFQRKLDRLQGFDSQSDVGVVRRESALALHALISLLPLVGFIIRSTNVRNAFEVYQPLLDLASNVLEWDVPLGQRKTRLLLSSEWEYSPFIYSEIVDLPDFVLIGLPAPESANPLLVPLAGHELGHRIWAKRRTGDHFEQRITDEIYTVISNRWTECQQVFDLYSIQESEIRNDLFVMEIVGSALSYALRQAEESFCDFIGVRIFGVSYLYAFSYLLSPNNVGPRTSAYPHLLARIYNIMEAAKQYDVTTPDNWEALFENCAEPNFESRDRLVLSIADAARQAVIQLLIDKADSDITVASIPKPSIEEAQRIYERFLLVVPAENAKCLADILNAAWLAYEEPDLWNKIPRISQARDEVLKELVLKNIEVFEIEQILREQS